MDTIWTPESLLGGVKREKAIKLFIELTIAELYNMSIVPLRIYF